MKRLLSIILALTLSASAFATYKVRNYCEDEVVFKYTTQDVLDSSWKAAGCEAHTVRDFTVLAEVLGHSVRAYEGTKTSMSNSSWTQVTFDTEDWDVDNEFDVTTNMGRYTPTVAGKYLVRATVSFAANATGVRSLRITKNGISHGEGIQILASTGVVATRCLAVDTLDMNGSTDYIEVEGYQNSGDSLDTIASSSTTFISITK